MEMARATETRQIPQAYPSRLLVSFLHIPHCGSPSRRMANMARHFRAWAHLCFTNRDAPRRRKGESDFLRGRDVASVEDENDVKQTLALIHTSSTLTPVFGGLCARYMPETAIFHMVDESLIADTIREGRLRRVTMRRLLALIESAEMAGADAVMVTCSSIGAGVVLGQQLFDIPVIRVDEAMAEAAVRMGKRIGVMATLRTTLEPTIALLREKAADAGIDIEIVDSLCDGAFDAVLAGDTDVHDRILSQALNDEMKGVDVVILAQASMARVVKAIPQGILSVPVLSSPELAVKSARTIMARLSGGKTVRNSVLVESAGAEARR